jgi:hypothetical protein
LMSNRRTALIVLAAIAVPAAWLVLRSESGSPRRPDVGPQPQAAGTSADSARERRLAAIDSSLRAIADGDRAAPGSRWDPEYVVRVVGRDPADLFGWVQDSTSWIPYRGELRGPVGVLLDRQGNSLDRALLLARLLEIAGHSVRLAHGPMSRDSAQALLPDLLELPPQDAGAGSALLDPAAPGVPAIAARYELDGAATKHSLQAQFTAATRFYSELRSRVMEQSARLAREVAPPDGRADWAGRFDSAFAALQDHWWVQRQDGDRWVDLDLLIPHIESPVTSLATPAETVPPGEIPASLHHQLTVRVVTEQWAGGVLSEHRILDHTLQPSRLYGQQVVLQIWPGEWPSQIHSDPHSKMGLGGVASQQTEWGVVLVVGKTPAAQATLLADGSVEEPRGGGPLGGLGAGIAGAIKRPVAASASGRSTMTAAWLEYEIRAPGAPSRTIRRAIFDLLGPAARSGKAPVTLALSDSQRLARSLALMLRTEILPVTSAMAPEYVSHLTAQAITANGSLLRAVAAAESPRLPDPDSLLAQAAPDVSTLYSLASARFAWSPVSDRIYVDRLGLLTRHRHPAVARGGFEVRGAVDVAAGDVGVSLAEPDAFRVRLQQGVLDTNAEGLWWNGATVLNAGEAYKASTNWMTLTPARMTDVGKLQLTADIHTRIAQDLAVGFVVIAPRAPVATGPEHFTGWWRIDPVTGTARGIGGAGWGQCQTDYAVLVLETAARGLWSGLFEYGLCQGLAQAYNEVMRQAADLQARGIWFNWVGSVQFASAGAVWQENHKACMISAIAYGGLIATLPIILKLRQAQKLKAAQRAAAERPPRFQRPRSGRPPPRPEPPPRVPRFVAEKEAAYRQAQLDVRNATQNYLKARAQGAPPALQNQHLEYIRTQTRANAEAFNDLLQARREAEELARNPGGVGGSSPMPRGNNNPTMSQLDVEFATELMEVGFGGLVR